MPERQRKRLLQPGCSGFSCRRATSARAIRSGRSGNVLPCPMPYMLSTGYAPYRNKSLTQAQLQAAAVPRRGAPGHASIDHTRRRPVRPRREALLACVIRAVAALRAWHRAALAVGSRRRSTRRAPAGGMGWDGAALECPGAPG